MRLKDKIAIVSMGSISPLGINSSQVFQNYLSDKTVLSEKKIGKKSVVCGKIYDQDLSNIIQIKNEGRYKNLDNSVLYGIYAARQALINSQWNSKDEIGINIGSSRGATNLFEKYHKEYLQTGKTIVQASPLTTLGNISSWVAHDLLIQGVQISHSITCSTSLHSLLNGVAWLQSGMVNKFMVGGSEAPLTPFTVAQMNAIKIYSKEKFPYPCRAGDIKKTQNTMVLGEGTSVMCLDTKPSKEPLAYINGVGYATEEQTNGVSLSTDGDCFQKSMQMAIKQIDMKQIDTIITHTPGTLQGDNAEYNAIKKIFGDELPLLTNNKWKIGHTFGASGLLSVEYAILMLKHNHFINVPFLPKQNFDKKLKNILVNAVGFGGNAVSVLISQ